MPKRGPVAAREAIGRSTPLDAGADFRNQMARQ
jgi:hypothetical protein